MSNFSQDLSFVLEKMESQYLTYPFICIYQYIILKFIK